MKAFIEVKVTNVEEFQELSEEFTSVQTGTVVNNGAR